MLADFAEIHELSLNLALAMKPGAGADEFLHGVALEPDRLS
jgi:hypothetical protein